MLENRVDLLSTQEQFTVGAIPGIPTDDGIDPKYSTLPFHGGNDSSINISNNYIPLPQSNSSEITDDWAIAEADAIETPTATEGEDWLTGIRLKSNSDGQNSFPLDFNSGEFVVGAPGEIKINYLVDGGGYRNGQLAIASLEGLEEENIEDRADLNKELARRALTNSELGHVVMSDAEEGALFNKELGEFNHNRGEYLGTKTFSMNPGDELAFIFVPNGKIEDVFNNPNIGGSRSPLYSLGTDSPDDDFPLEQFVDVTGEGEVFAFEDIKIESQNADRDYNDLIFSVSGVAGEATSINQAINPQKDWRNLANGQEFLELVEALKNDTAGPEISIELAKDNGLDNTDGITSDPTLTGTLSDDLKIVSLRVGFDETSAEEYVEIIDLVDGEGNFTLDESKLTEIFGDSLADSPYTVNFIAEDAADNQSTREITFTLDTSLPQFPLFFDSGEFIVGNSGEIQIDYLFDGGGYRNGQLAIASLEGLEEIDIEDRADFNKELARRALTNSELGHLVMSDAEEGALFNKELGEFNHNRGEYLGVKTFSMNPGDKYAFIFVPNGKIEDVFNNPNIGGSRSPLYSLGTDSPDDDFPLEQFVDVTGEGEVFAFEDIKIEGQNGDRDYNDLIFSVKGATGEATPINEAINPQKDWRELDNGQEFLELVEGLRNDTEAPEISVELANDTGADNNDGITSEATLTGTVTDDEEIVSLRVGFNDTPTEEYQEIIDLVDAEGNFNLDQSKLTEILGKNLEYSPYTLNLIAKDAAENESTTEIAFTPDTEAPELSLLVPIAGGDHSSTARLIGKATDGASGLSTVEYSLDGQAFSTVEIDAEGKFDTALGGLSQGPHQLELQLTDLAGNQAQQPLDFSVTDDFIVAADGSAGWGASSTDTVILGEKDSLLSQVTVPLELGQGEGKRTLKFSLDAQFDTADSKAIEDIFQVFIKNSAGETLMDGGPEGTAAFSLAGEVAEYVPGTVTFNGSDVEIDLSSLSEDPVLVFKLINSDTDTGSIVKVESISNTLDEEGFVGPSFPVKSETLSPASELEIENLSINPDLELILGNVRLNETSGEYIATVRVQNNSFGVIGQNIAVLFNELPQGIELQNQSGSDTTGNPYINLRNGIPRGGLDFGQTSDPVEVIFSNPDLLEFPLAATVLAGGENIAPEFESLSDLSVTPGERLSIPLVATDADGDRVEFAIESDEPLPAGKLTGDGTLIFTPTPEEIGNYELRLIASDGTAETTQSVNLTVAEDSITTTRLTGTIENTSEEPLESVVIELGDLITTTSADGSFVIEVEGELPDDTLKIRGETISGDISYPFIAEKLPLVLEREPYTGYNNVIWRPIYLPPIDTANAETIDPATETLVTTDAIPGASVLVPANGLRDQEGNPYTGELSITAVPNDLTPAALPTDLEPDLVVTIQPGEMVFTTPAPLSLPNIAGYEPGTEMDLWSINPNTGLFDNVGVGRVSSDGSVVETISGGIRNSSWHFFTPPAPEAKDPEDNPYNPDETCNECKETEGFTSVVELHSGAVVETHDLVPYQSLGESRGLRLTYDSLRADARPILHFGYENVQANPDRRLVGNLTVSRGAFEYQLPGVEEGEFGLRAGDRLWSIPQVGGEIDAALQVDLRSLPSGQYDYQLDSGLRLFNGERFTGSSTTFNGKFLHVNSIESSMGSGWGLAGKQELIENPDASVLLVDGDGSELLFEADGDGNFVSPPGDFSVLERLPDGTFRRTLKDKTVYEFDAENRLATMRETNGNETEYVYDGRGRLEIVVDPAGLETSFVYVDGRLSEISDPAGRTTQLRYDSAGNLTEIIDPDSSRRQFGYDGEHRLVEEIDKRGEVERAEYDFAGRASGALRKDGSRLEVAPVQVQGLYRPFETVKPFDAPEAFALGEAVASTIDANGFVAAKTLDRSGQVVSAVDGGGLLPTVERDEENLVRQRTNARGNVTNYIPLLSLSEIKK